MAVVSLRMNPLTESCDGYKNNKYYALAIKVRRSWSKHLQEILGCYVRALIRVAIETITGNRVSPFRLMLRRTEAVLEAQDEPTPYLIVYHPSVYTKLLVNTWLLFHKVANCFQMDVQIINNTVKKPCVITALKGHRFISVPIRTRFLESFQLFTLQFLDGGHDGLERSFQPLPEHHVVRLGPKPDAVFILICGEGELAHIQLLQTEKAPIRSVIQCINIQQVKRECGGSMGL